MDRDQETLEFFASAIPKTAGVLTDEMRELGYKSIRPSNSGVLFRGTWEEGWRACLESRIAQRIQLVLHRFQAPTQEALYDGIQAIDWTPYITPDHTISVSAVCVASNINHSGFAALKTKDAVVDQIRSKDAKQRRPSVSKTDADVRIFLYLGNDKATAYLDMSGDGLHRRGYRQETGEAPLRETLAAALLRMSGWDRKTPFLDPMCGSGTIAIEAAMWAVNRAPGLNRERFGFERWANFDEDKAERMRRLRGELRGMVSGNPPRVQACDIDGAMIDIAQRNARAAGVRLSFKQRSILDLQRGESARRCVLTNPPYDARLGADEALRKGIASAICRMHGCRVALLSGHKDYEHYISARPQLNVALLNGAIACHFLVYEID